MRFLTPLSLLGLALIALPIAIHLLVRRRAKRIDFPSLQFLRETPSFRLRPRHIQQPLLLLLRIAAITFLVLGLARPLFTYGTKVQRKRVILIDGSLSMQALGRVDAAREIARRLINGLPQDERVAIIEFSTDSTVLSSMTSNKRELSDAIDRYQPGNGSADYSIGLKAAGLLLEHEAPGDAAIDLVSDFQESGLQQNKADQIAGVFTEHTKIVTHPVGARVEQNAFLVDVEAITGESQNEIAATEILNTANGRSASRRKWSLDSRDGANMGLTWRTESNGQISARIAAITPDEFDADDERFLVFSPKRMERLLLIEDEETAPYLGAAIEASATDVGGNQFSLERKSALPTSTTELAEYSLVAFTLHGSPQTMELRALADFARAGGTVWILLGSDVITDQWNQFTKTEDGRAFPISALVRKSDFNDTSGFGTIDIEAPALKVLNSQVLTSLQSIRMRQGFIATPNAGAATLIRWNDGSPAFVGLSVGKGTMLLFATSPARAAGDLGTSVAFPALASSIVRFGIGQREPVAREIGQPVNLKLAPQSSIIVVDSTGKTKKGLASDLVVSPVTFFPSPGIYRVESKDAVTYLAFNAPVTESETPLVPPALAENQFKVEMSPAIASKSAWHDAAERTQGASRFFLLIAFILFGVEWFIAMKQGGMREGGG